MNAMYPLNDTTGPAEAVSAARPVVLVRARSDLAAESQRVVHLAPLPVEETGILTALCGMVLARSSCEVVTPGRGAPCDGCLASHLTLDPPVFDDVRSPPEHSGSDSPCFGVGLRDAAVTYRGWGWPVVLRRDQLWLALGRDAVALMVPTTLAGRVTELLTTRRCLPAVLEHPDAAEHRVLLAGERYGVALPWPVGVHRITSGVLLPPTVSPRGPLTWMQPPEPDSLRRCREIDVLTALRALPDPPSPTGPGKS
jgi:hypothetical protein